MTPPKCSADITSVSNEDGGEVGGVVQTSLMGMLKSCERGMLLPSAFGMLLPSK
jgi:hypothetical protein